MSWVYRRPFRPQQKRKLTPSLFTAVTGDQTISPSLVSQLLAGVDPAITTGNVNLTPSLVSQLLAAVDPAVTTGNVNLTPSLVSQLLAGVDPAVTTGNVNLSPSLVSQLLAGVDPALTSNINLSPSLVSQLLAGVAPALTTGNVNLTPSLVSQLLAGVDPAITSNVNLVPSLVSQLLAGVAPSLTTGNVNLSPSLVSQLLAGVAPTLTGGSLISIAAGFDIARFYRANETPYFDIYSDYYDTQLDPLLVLVVGLPRSVGIGFRTVEAWETASGHFALPVVPRHPLAKKEAIEFVFVAWDANKGDTQAVLTTAINAALTAAGYTRPNGVAIT